MTAACTFVALAIVAPLYHLYLCRVFAKANR